MTRVYFMRRTDGVGPIKIGCSKMLPRRLAAMQVWSPHIIEVVAHCPGTFADEQRLHRQFAEHRLHGEWFEPAPELLSVVARVASVGQLPPSPLNDKYVQIISRLKAGETYASVAADFGVTRQRVDQIAKKAGLRLGYRPEVFRKAPIWGRIDEAKSLAAQGYSVTQIALQVQDSKANVYNALKAVGVKTLKTKRQRNPDTIAKAFAIAADYKSGMRGADIAAKYGIWQPTIYHFLRIAGVKPKRRKGDNSIDINVEELIRRYQSGETIKSLSDVYSCATATLRSRLHEHGVLRSRKENEAIRIGIVKAANQRRFAA